MTKSSHSANSHDLQQDSLSFFSSHIYICLRGGLHTEARLDHTPPLHHRCTWPPASRGIFGNISQGSEGWEGRLAHYGVWVTGASWGGWSLGWFSLVSCRGILWSGASGETETCMLWYGDKGVVGECEQVEVESSHVGHFHSFICKCNHPISVTTQCSKVNHSLHICRVELIIIISTSH